MRARILITVLASILLAGCTGTGGTATVGSATYTAPHGFDLDGRTTADVGENASFTYPLGVSYIEISALDLNWTTEEFQEQGAYLLLLLAGGEQVRNTTLQKNGRNWVVVETRVAAGDQTGSRILAATHANRTTYVFELTRIKDAPPRTEIFLQSVYNTRFGATPQTRNYVPTDKPDTDYNYAAITDGLSDANLRIWHLPDTRTVNYDNGYRSVKIIDVYEPVTPIISTRKQLTGSKEQEFIDKSILAKHVQLFRYTGDSSLPDSVTSALTRYETAADAEAALQRRPHEIADATVEQVVLPTGEATVQATYTQAGQHVCRYWGQDHERLYSVFTAGEELRCELAARLFTTLQTRARYVHHRQGSEAAATLRNAVIPLHEITGTGDIEANTVDYNVTADVGLWRNWTNGPVRQRLQENGVQQQRLNLYWSAPHQENAPADVPSPYTVTSFATRYDSLPAARNGYDELIAAIEARGGTAGTEPYLAGETILRANRTTPAGRVEWYIHRHDTLVYGIKSVGPEGHTRFTKQYFLQPFVRVTDAFNN